VPEETDGQGRRGSGRVLSTAQHAFQALEIIAQNPRGIPIKALARRLNISLSSGYYLISSMREQGLAEVSPAGPGLYTLGPKVSLLYEGYVAATCQPERLTPVLEELRVWHAGSPYYSNTAPAKNAFHVRQARIKARKDFAKRLLLRTPFVAALNARYHWFEPPHTYVPPRFGSSGMQSPRPDEQNRELGPAP
jgi:DNA-binding Lrp family transcriptional regulator